MENIKDRKDLSGGSIKLIAMFLMVLDHIYYYIGAVGVQVPIYFTWLGRIVAPIFIYMTVEGYRHTRNKKKYILRLYIASVLMNLGNYLIPEIFKFPGQVPIINGMFSSLFLLVVYLSFVDILRGGIKNKKIGEALKGLGLLILPLLINLLFLNILVSENTNLIILRLVMTLVPLPFLVEGGINFLFLGILFYIFRKNKKSQVLVYLISCLPYFLETGFNINTMLYVKYQWMMVFAAPLMLAYNGKKGPGLKYLFYIFYPAHIYILYIISWALVKHI